MAKQQKMTQRKVPDGYIRPKNPSNISENPAPLQPNPPAPDFVRLPPAGDTHVVKPPAK
jgi:hypothetical protein